MTPTPAHTHTPTPVPDVLQLTSFSGARNPRISDDGSVLTYSVGVTSAYLATTDGRNNRKLTDGCRSPRPSADGNRVVMECAANLTGDNADGNREIVLLDRIDFVPITRSPNTVFNHSTGISADGRVVAFSSDGNYTGANVDGSLEIFLWREGQALQQVRRRK